MIPKHSQFLDAIHEKRLIRIEYHSAPDDRKISCVCAPLDYGPAPDSGEAHNYYWIWDDARSAGPNPQGLRGDQILSLRVLDHSFSPDGFPYEPGSRSFRRQSSSESEAPDIPAGTTHTAFAEPASTRDAI